MMLKCVFYCLATPERMNQHYVVKRFGSPTDAKLGGGRLAHTEVI
jgi:hypothetical protein